MRNVKTMLGSIYELREEVKEIENKLVEPKDLPILEREILKRKLKKAKAELLELNK